MRNNVFFKTRLFNNKEPGPNFINPRCFGEDLVDWLLTRLQDAPFRFSNPIQEDYGWGFWVEKDFWVSVAVMDDSIGIDNPEWLISVNYDPGLNLKKRLFGKIDTAQQKQICDALNRALQNEGRITEIRWCNDKETDCGESPS